MGEKQVPSCQVETIMMAIICDCFRNGVTKKPVQSTHLLALGLIKDDIACIPGLLVKEAVSGGSGSYLGRWVFFDEML